jgi:hypothetical protein
VLTEVCGKGFAPGYLAVPFQVRLVDLKIVRDISLHNHTNYVDVGPLLLQLQTDAAAISLQAAMWKPVK